MGPGGSRCKKKPSTCGSVGLDGYQVKGMWSTPPGLKMSAGMSSLNSLRCLFTAFSNEMITVCHEEQSMESVLNAFFVFAI